jgi:hypothetical protein
MSELTTLSKLHSKIADDPNVSVWHMTIYTCLLNLWLESGFQKQIKVTRKLLMSKAHIRSTSTYHKCMNHLTELGYITYIPTYDSYTGSKIEIMSANHQN